MIHRVYGILGRRVSVAGSVFYDVAAGHKVKFPLFEDFSQFSQVSRICDVYRYIVGENVYVFFVSHGNVHDPPSVEARLSFFRPAEFVQRQINFISHIPYLRRYGFMTQAERVEGPRKKGHFLRFPCEKIAVFQLVFGDKAIYMLEHGGIIEEIQLIFAAVFIQRYQFFAALTENLMFFRQTEFFGSEDVHAYGPESFLTYDAVIIGKPFDYQVYQLVLSGCSGLFALFVSEQASIYFVVFGHHSECVKNSRRHLTVGSSQEFFQVEDKLIQLSRRKMEHDDSQIIGNIF